MASIDELKQERLDKLNALEKSASSAYPAKNNNYIFIDQFLADFNAENKTEFTLVGRIMTKRSFGALAFAKLSMVQVQHRLYSEAHSKEL